MRIKTKSQNISVEVTLFLTSICLTLFNNVHGYISPPTEKESTSHLLKLHEETLITIFSTDHIDVGSLLHQLDGKRHQQLTISTLNLLISWIATFLLDLLSVNLEKYIHYFSYSRIKPQMRGEQSNQE